MNRTISTVVPAVDPGHRLLQRRQFSRNFTPFAVLSGLVIAVMAFLAMYPLFRVALRMVYNDGRFDWRPLSSMLDQPGLIMLLYNTIIVVVTSAVVSVLIGAVMAWINERTDARMGVLTDALPLVPFLLPPIAGAIGWVLLLSDRAGLLNAMIRWVVNGLFGTELTTGPFDIYTWPGLVFVYVIYSIPYVYMLMSAGLRNVDSSLEEQSRVCGASLFLTMRKVTLPAVMPSLGASILLLVWFGMSLFSVPAVIGQGAKIEVLAVRIVRLLTFTYPADIPRALALCSFVILGVGLAYYFQARILRKGRHATIDGKGNKATRIKLGRWKWLAQSVIIGYILIAAVLPMVALLLVALNGFWTPNIRWLGLTLESFREVLIHDDLTRAALANSLLLGIGGATLGILAAAILALFVQRTGKGVARFIDATIKLPAAISTIVLAVGFLLAFSGPPFNLNGTFLILLLSYLALYMPQASVVADAAAAQVGRELSEASQVAGASSGRTFLRISLPLMAAGLAAGWALLFVRMIGDLTASALLAGTDNPVVGTRILEVFNSASWALLAALSTVLTLVSMLVIVVLLIQTRRRGSGVSLGASARSA